MQGAGGPVRPRPLAPGEGRRARRSCCHPLSDAFLSDHAAFRTAVEALAPLSTPDLPIHDLILQPATEVVQQAIAERLADPSITAKMPKVEDLERDRVALRKQRHVEKRNIVDPMMSKLCLRNWIGPKQIQAQIDAALPDLALLEPGEDLIATMIIFHHEDAAVPVQELQLLGCNTLQEAAGRIFCHMAMKAPVLPELLPSSYFLIEDRFHDDCLTAGARPMSKSIIDWVFQERRHTNKSLGLFRRGSPMHLMRISDLEIRPGTVYHYVHLGGCRHAIMFTDVAVLSASDVRKRSAYPLQTALMKEKRKRCGVCDINAANFVTYSDRLASANPFFFCSGCYHPMHYTEDGSLLYDGYKVYPYIFD